MTQRMPHLIRAATSNSASKGLGVADVNSSEPFHQDPNQPQTATLFALYYEWLKRALHRKTGDLSTAEEVASETFVELLKQPQRDPIAEPRAFLRTIANRVLYKIWRRRDLERACADTLATLYASEMQFSAEKSALLIDAIALIDRVLESLSDEEREIFLRCRIDKATYGDVGEEYGLSASAVRRIVGKGLRLCLLVMEEE
jgi:RNA polymerase sigma factor (sigma-70 family)